MHVLVFINYSTEYELVWAPGAGLEVLEMEKKKSCIYRDSNYRSYSPYPRRCWNFEYCPSFHINKSTRFCWWICLHFQMERKKRGTYSGGPIRKSVSRWDNVQNFSHDHGPMPWSESFKLYFRSLRHYTIPWNVWNFSANIATVSFRRIVALWVNLRPRNTAQITLSATNKLLGGGDA